MLVLTALRDIPDEKPVRRRHEISAVDIGVKRIIRVIWMEDSLLPGMLSEYVSASYISSCIRNGTMEMNLVLRIW